MISYVLLLAFTPFTQLQLTTRELEEENAQEIANRTYVEEQTELQRAILSKYNKRVRPVLNISEPLDVAVHVYIMHISVNQMEQTITLNGHIYMWSRIEIYPTFSIKIGCKFDYSAYPFDIQTCALGIYTTNRMSEVQLSVYYNMQPTVLLGWGAQSGKKHISDWMIDSVTMNVSYFNSGTYKAEKPTDAEELDVSWSILYTWLTLHRNSSYFTLTLLLPTIISYIFIICSFLLPAPDSAIHILLANLFFLGIFLEDFTAMIPPAIGRLPKIVWFFGVNLALTMIAIFSHLWLRYLLKREGNVTRFYLYVLYVKRLIPKRYQTTLLDDGTASTEGDLIL
uniref:Neurotransmitter-gated ion-channel ligand-binding domain-containing protein n=1 Tax=Setaria digitata TaxID=48799 RepID=A0A915PI96_9BILA